MTVGPVFHHLFIIIIKATYDMTILHIDTPRYGYSILCQQSRQLPTFEKLLQHRRVYVNIVTMKELSRRERVEMVKMREF